MPVSLRKMETWHCKGQQGGIVMLHFFFVTLGCHFHINVRKYDVCFLHLKLPISCWSKDRAHPYLGYAVLVNDRNLHCHINNMWSVRFDPSGSTVFTSTIFRSTVRRNFNCIPGYPDKTKVSTFPYIGFLGGTMKESSCHCRRHKKHGFNPGVRKIPWSRKWWHTPVFLPGKFQEVGNMVVNRVAESDTSEHTHTWLNLSILRLNHFSQTQNRYFG